MSFVHNNAIAGASGSQNRAYNIERSLRFRRSATAYINRTPSSASNRQTWTLSFWAKRGLLNNGSTTQTLFQAFNSANSSGLVIFLLSGDNIQIYSYDNNVNQFTLNTTQVFRDPSAWYHFVFVLDTTNATASNRVRIFVNGSQITSFSTANYPSQNYNSWINNNNLHGFGVNLTNNADAFDGYIAEMNFVDGQVLTPSDFGMNDPQTGVWEPKRYTGTYGTNGFYLNFNDISAATAAAIGKDSSGNGNNWTPNNISLTSGSTYDSMTDVPTLTSATAANYATFNPIGNGGGSLSNGNLRSSTSSTTPDVGTMALLSGKWYWEVTVTTSSNPRVGVYDIGAAAPTNFGGTANGWALVNNPSRIFTNGGTTNYGSFSGTNGDVVMMAYDAGTGNLWFGANGTWFASGNPATATSPSVTGLSGKSIVPAVASGTGANVFDLNCGQRPFAYTPPSGFVALNTFNLPTPTIGATASTQANKYFDATLFNSSGNSQNIINAGGFRPDFIWQKSRGGPFGTTGHILNDTVRGLAFTLSTNGTGAEGNNPGLVTAVNANGWTQNGNGIYFSGDPIVGWQWQAGQGNNVTNTSGSITSTVSANTSAGFSIVTFNSGSAGNKTVGHGLGVKPAMMIFKDRVNSGTSWQVWHQSLSNQAQSYLNLHNSNAAATDSRIWANTAPTSTVFSFESGYGFLANSNIVAYCFAEVDGYSRFGSYTGNGSSDGPFIYTGFRPKFVMVKSHAGVTLDWAMKDTSRDPYNAASNTLLANLSSAEIANNGPIDILSNGFKVRSTNDNYNNGSGSYIYMAFAENPFKYSLAR